MRKTVKRALCLLLSCMLAAGFAACGNSGDDGRGGGDKTADLLKEALASITVPATLTEDLTLPTLTEEKYAGIALSFSSSNTAALANNGKVTRALTDVDVVFTVTAEKDGVFEDKDFNVKIVRRAKTDSEKLEDAKERLDLGDLSGVTENVTLPDEDIETGAAIAWATDDEDVITADGVITRPAYGQPAATATLTATLTLGEASATRTFDVTVLAMGVDSLSMSYAIETATLTLESGVPTMTLAGKTYLDEASAVKRTIKLTIGSGTTAITLANGAAETELTDGSFRFVQDLSELTLPTNTWLNVKLELTESGLTKTSDITATSEMTAERVEVDANTAYEFKSYQSALKLNKSSKPTITESSASSVFFTDEGGKTYFNVVGNMYFSDDTTAERSIKLTLSHSKLPSPIELTNRNDTADTSRYAFKLNLSDDFSTAAYNEWVTMKFSFTEKTAFDTLSYNGDLAPGSLAIGEANKFSANYLKCYFVVQNDVYLKLVVGSDSDVKADYLSDVQKVNLTQEDGKVYLNMSGTAHIGTVCADVSRTIYLMAGTTRYENTLTEDAAKNGSYAFKADITKKFANQGNIKLFVYVEEGALSKSWEVKQAAFDNADGAIVAKPGSGKTAVLEACGTPDDGVCKYHLEVDEWNNIRVNVTSTAEATLSDLKTASDVSISQEDGKVYLNLSGSAYIDENESARTLRFFLTDDKKFSAYYDNLSTDADTKKFLFKVDITDLVVTGDWYKFRVEVTEGDLTLLKAFNTFTYTDPTTDQDANTKVISDITQGEKKYRLKIGWGQVYIAVVKA